MSEIQWKVGDNGVTRDGRRYEVLAVFDSGDDDYPIEAEIDGEGGPDYFTCSGRYYGPGETDERDLMPPSDMQPAHSDARQSVDCGSAQAPSPTGDERRERIACAVLVGLAADRHRSDVQGSAENAACIAVAWADALIAELAK